jgi:hypothetical protein
MSLAGPTVPYRDAVTGRVTALVPTGPTTFTQSIAGKREAIHLGRFEMTGTHTVKFLSPQDGQLLGGSFTYTFKDGSTMTGTYSGTFRRVGAVVRFDLTVLAQGGTGRLNGVTGVSQTVVIGIGPDPGKPFTYTSVGTLTFP